MFNLLLLFGIVFLVLNSMNEQWQKFYDRTIDWLVSFGPRILLSIIILVAGLWVIRLFNRWLRRSMEKRRFDRSLRPFLQNLFHGLLVVLLVLALMQILGIQMTIFATMIAALTVAAGLALSGTLQNFSSGVLILVQRPYRVGDTIGTQGTEGMVTSIRLFYTVVMTYDNKTIYIPNGQLFNNIIINLSREGKRRMDIELKFHYGINSDDIKNILRQSITAIPSILKEPAYRLGIQTLEPDRYVFVVQVWTAAHGYQDTKLELQERMLKDLKAAGIRLPGIE